MEEGESVNNIYIYNIIFIYIVLYIIFIIVIILDLYIIFIIIIIIDIGIKNYNYNKNDIPLRVYKLLYCYIDIRIITIIKII